MGIFVFVSVIPPPELKHSQDTCRQNVTGGIIIDTSKTDSFLPISSENSSNLEYGQKFLLLDELTGEILSKVCYEVHKKDGAVIHGTTDEDGLTELITSDKEEDIELRIIFKEHDHD